MNIAKMMKQAQEMQKKMAELQEEIAKVELEGQSGGGMVKVTLNGKGEMRALSIDPSLLDPEEGEMLEDLIKAAFQSAKTKVDQYSQEEMSKVTGGLGLPSDMKLPF